MDIGPTEEDFERYMEEADMEAEGMDCYGSLEIPLSDCLDSGTYSMGEWD